MAEKITIDDMSLEEKRTWAVTGIMVVSFLTYLGIVTVRGFQPGPMIEVSWVAPMAWTFGCAAAASFLSIAFLGRRVPKSERRKDIRDEQFEQFGNAVGNGFFGMGGIAALILLMIDVDRFWVANTLFFAMILAGIFGSFAKLGAYREGIERL